MLFMKVLLVTLLAFSTSMLVSSAKLLVGLDRSSAVVRNLWYMLILGVLLVLFQAMIVYTSFFASGHFGPHDLAAIAIGVAVGYVLAEVLK